MPKGQRSKYTEDTVKALEQAIGMGATYRLASQYAGISEDTFARWRDRYADFAARIKRAEGRAAVGWLAKIEKAANEGTWQAAAWKLERRYPHEYGRQVQEQAGAVTLRVVYGDDSDG
jgi:transposase